MAGLTVRDAAKLLIKTKRLEAMEAAMQAKIDEDDIAEIGAEPKRRGRPPKAAGDAAEQVSA
jgi:hypothetical protein